MMLAVLTFSAVAAAAAPPLSVDDAVAATLERSPLLAEAQAEVQRTEGLRRAECGLRSDPTVQASTALVGEAWWVRASQPLSLTGEGIAACDAARQSLDASRARLTRRKLEVTAAARLVWVDAVAASAHEDLALLALDVARAIEGATRRRVEVGDASELDLRLAVLTVEQARAAWMAAAMEEGTRLEALSSATGVPVDGLLLPTDPLAGAPEPRSVASGGPARSDVAAAQAEVEAARAALSRARRETLPPVAVGVFVEEEGPEFRAGPTVALTLPLWRANVDGRSSAGAELAAAEVRAEATARQVAAEQATTRRTLAVVEAALKDQPSDLPEQARTALASVELGYSRGELDLLSASMLQAEVLEGNQAWIEARRLVARARIDALLATEHGAAMESLDRPAVDARMAPGLEVQGGI